jgi:hypothetical protein
MGKLIEGCSRTNLSFLRSTPNDEICQAVFYGKQYYNTVSSPVGLSCEPLAILDVPGGREAPSTRTDSR